MFSKALIADAVETLPGLPDTESLDEVKAHLRQVLHYNSEGTRQRYAAYVTKQMFPAGVADAALRRFAQAFAGTQALKDVALYRLMQGEPLMLEVVGNVMVPAVGAGRVTRGQITSYLAGRFPELKSVADCVNAIADAVRSSALARVDKQVWSLGYRPISLPAFAFVLHSEFGDPGMHELAELEANGAMRALLWNPDGLLSALYDLRNDGLISKVSEIDFARQFTTRFTLDEAVEHLARERVAQGAAS
jgi:DNA repair protein RadC